MQRPPGKSRGQPEGTVTMAGADRHRAGEGHPATEDTAALGDQVAVVLARMRQAFEDGERDILALLKAATVIALALVLCAPHAAHAMSSAETLQRDLDYGYLLEQDAARERQGATPRPKTGLGHRPYAGRVHQHRHQQPKRGHGGRQGERDLRPNRRDPVRGGMKRIECSNAMSALEQQVFLVTVEVWNQIVGPDGRGKSGMSAKPTSWPSCSWKRTGISTAHGGSKAANDHGPLSHCRCARIRPERGGPCPCL